ncbi:MAG: thioredoxin domain-containing protein [Ideonella sp.]
MSDTSPSDPQPSDDPFAALSAAEHQMGAEDARATLVEYGDYECPACIQAEPLMRHLVDSTKGRLRFVYRHFPLMEVHPHAELAAEAAEAAAAQGKFWPMHHQLFDQKHHLELPALTGYAEAIGLDMNRFKAEMADRIYTQRVQEHRRSAEQLGLRATPAFLLNGKLVDASFGFEKVSEAVHAALKGG